MDCAPREEGTTLQISEEVKYLRVSLDKQLLWNKYSEVKMKRALTALILQYWISRQVEDDLVV